MAGKISPIAVSGSVERPLDKLTIAILVACSSQGCKELALQTSCRCYERMLSM